MSVSELVSKKLIHSKPTSHTIRDILRRGVTRNSDEEFPVEVLKLRNKWKDDDVHKEGIIPMITFENHDRVEGISILVNHPHFLKVNYKH